jgi:predicted ATPase
MTQPGGTEERPASELGRLQFFDAMTTLLGEVGHLRGPGVVVIEDLQWVDESSGEFLRFLVSRMQSERLLVVATVRSEGLAARPRVRGLLSELGRMGWVQRLDLAPFDESEVAEYLARLDSTSNPDVAAAVRRGTGETPTTCRPWRHPG